VPEAGPPLAGNFCPLVLAVPVPFKKRKSGRGVWGEFRPPSPESSVRIFSNTHRQLVKAKFGSPSTRARQPILGTKLNFLSLFREAERQKRAFLNFNLLKL